MTENISKGLILQEALNQPWPVAGSEIFIHSTNNTHHLDNPALLCLLLQDALDRQRIALDTAILPQLHKLDESLSISHKILNRLAFVDFYYEQLSRHSYLDTDILNLQHELRMAIIRSVLRGVSFITNSRHPLRIIMDDLCHWGIGWDKNLGKNAERYLSLLKKLAAIGSGLPEDAWELPGSYTATLNALGELASRYKKIEERVCEAEQSSMATLTIRRKVETIINEQIAGNPLPASAISFFHGIWCDILHRLLVLKGTEHAEWLETLQLMDKLVFCLSPHPGSRPEQINLIPALIQSLKRMLQSSGYNASNTYLFDDLIATFKQIMTGEAIPLHTAPPLTNLTIEGISTNVSSAITQQVTRLKPGQWILCKDDKSQVVRGKLAMMFPEAGRVLFVNLLGSKPFFKKVEDLGLALNTKRTRLLASNNLSDIVLTITIDLFIKRYQETLHPQSNTDQASILRKQSAEKALAEAQQLRKLAASESKTVAPAVPLVEEEMTKVEAMVHSLKIGSWVSMKNRLGEQMPCKVAVIYASSGKMVITDKAGLRVGEFLRPELSQLIMKGEASILEIADSFESSLSRVLQTLRKNL